MRKLYLLLLLFSCGVSKPVQPPVVVIQPPVVVKPPPAHPDPVPEIVIIDTFRIPGTGQVSVKDFGAKCDGITDDIIADSMACTFCALNPTICRDVIFPVGTSRISRPLRIEIPGKFVTVNLKGYRPAKSAPEGILSQIFCDYTEGPGISFQLARGVVVENLSLIGRYRFPDRVKNSNIGIYKFSDWADGSVTDSRYNPHAGIVIDPHENASGSQGGSSDMTIKNCLIRYFMVGICLSPNPVTANAEMVNIIDCDIELVRVGIAIGQDQAKTILISGLKVWGSTHTILDGLTYGRGTGGGAVFCENWNIAGNVNQLFFMYNDRFPLSAKDIYSESIFRIGTLGGSAGANCINFEIDFLSGPGWPAADYLIAGGANFYGGCIRYYDNNLTHRMNLINSGGLYRDMVLSTAPFVCGLYGYPQNKYPEPGFENVHLYVPGTELKKGMDTLIKIPSPGPTVIIDRIKWAATMTHIPPDLKIGDYILASPNGKYYDQAQNSSRCPTAQIGRVISIVNGLATLDDVGLNVYTDTPYDGFFINRLK